MAKFRTIVSRRRKPDEVAIARVAIRNFCLECVGYVVQEVEQCTDPECWLFPWRQGSPTEFAALRTPAQKAAAEALGDRLRK